MARTGNSRRTALIEATKELLWERGYEATSPRDMLDRSGAGQGSLYHHFSGKLELAGIALTEMAEEEMAAIAAIFDPAKPPLDRVHAYLSRERDALRGCRLARLANEAAVELPAFRQPIAAFLDRIIELLHASLAEAQASGQLRPGIAPSIVATTLLAVIEGGYVLARAHWEPRYMAEAVGGALALLRTVATVPIPAAGRLDQ